MGCEEKGLALRLKARDARAMAEVYDRYGRLVYAVIRRQVRRHEITEDLVQETFLKLWTGMDAFDGERALGPWLMALARNRAIDYLRSMDHRITHGQVELDPAGQAFAVTACFEGDVVQRDQLRSIREAMTRLRPQHRRVLEMAFGEGLTHAEIAGLIREPLGTVKTWVRTALKVLREQTA
jgi:RNA polymerase sigma-70 factor (ECF subfamily)